MTQTQTVALNTDILLDIVDAIRQNRLAGWQRINRIGQRIELGQEITTDEAIEILTAHPQATAAVRKAWS